MPGVAVCVGVAIAATSIQFLEQRFTGELYLEALVIAIVLGTMIRTAGTPGPRLLPGIDFGKILLEIAKLRNRSPVRHGPDDPPVALALATAIRPSPWFNPRNLVPLAGIILGNVRKAAPLTLDGVLGGAERERESIEARLALGTTYWVAIGPTLREAMRRGLVPIIDQMSAAGVVTLPGIMTGQIIAGMDPIEAAKYQILLMFLLSDDSGICVLLSGYLAARGLSDKRERLRLDRLHAPNSWIFGRLPTGRFRDRSN